MTDNTHLCFLRVEFLMPKYLQGKKNKQERRAKSKSCFCPLFSACMCVMLFPTVMTHGSAVSPLYHFTLSDGTPLSAQTRCKFCCPPNPDVQPFIMGIHTIDRYPVQHWCLIVVVIIYISLVLPIFQHILQLNCHSFPQGTQHCELSGKHYPQPSTEPWQPWPNPLSLPFSSSWQQLDTRLRRRHLGP